jgi:hypothetical protein
MIIRRGPSPKFKPERHWQAHWQAQRLRPGTVTVTGTQSVRQAHWPLSDGWNLQPAAGTRSRAVTGFKFGGRLRPRRAAGTLLSR